MLYYEQNRKTTRDHICFRQYCIFGGAGVSTESGILISEVNPEFLKAWKNMAIHLRD